MKKFFALIVFSLVCFGTNAQQIVLSLVTSSLTAPVDLKHAGDKRLFIVERGGTIRIYDSTGVLRPLPFLNITDVLRPLPFLNITDRVLSSGGEQGLLGLAFDPLYKTNGFFYVCYTRKFDGWIRISRFHLTGNSNHCDSTTEQILLTVYHPFTNHNGGALAFRNDGYLYASMGDGGNGGDPGNRAQNLDTLLGKILRLDVSDSSVAYKIPPDNPFVGKPGRDEIWAYGLRNPWRFSFDRLTNDLWIADVGQGQHEEINFETPDTGGINYGWRCYEGNASYNLSNCGPVSNYIFPVYTYSHTDSNCSVTGGYRYRGSQFPAFEGKYFYTDYCKGTLRYLEETSPGVFTSTVTNVYVKGVSAFGEDVNGELYIVSLGNHAVYRLCDQSCITGVEDRKVLQGISIAPNPGDGDFMLRFNSNTSQTATITVADLTGRIVLTMTRDITNGENNVNIPLKHQPKGIYLLSIKTTAGTSVHKIVLQ